jgi:hypothetical protein
MISGRLKLRESKVEILHLLRTACDANSKSTDHFQRTTHRMVLRIATGIALVRTFQAQMAHSILLTAMMGRPVTTTAHPTFY